MQALIHHVHVTDSIEAGHRAYNTIVGLDRKGIENHESADVNRFAWVCPDKRSLEYSEQGLTTFVPQERNHTVGGLRMPRWPSSPNHFDSSGTERGFRVDMQQETKKKTRTVSLKRRTPPSGDILPANLKPPQACSCSCRV